LLFSVLAFGLVYLLHTANTPGDGKGGLGFVQPLVTQVSQQMLPDASTSGGAFQSGGAKTNGAESSGAQNPPAATVAGGTLTPQSPAARSVFRSETEQGGIIRRTLVVGRGETLTSRLIAAGITRTEVLMALEVLRQKVNPQKVRGGQEVAVLFRHDPTNPAAEAFYGLELHASSTELVTITRNNTNAGGFQASSHFVEPNRRRFAIRGRIDGSLYESGLKMGIPKAVLNTIVKTYTYNVDFQRDIKSGDRFEVFFEQLTDDHGSPVGDPTLIYSALEVGGNVLPIYRVATSADSFEYYDARGESIRKGLLRTPVEGARVTSGFGMRMHPLLGYSRMHKGIDFGAPSGTPIYAAGAGIVEDAGMHNGYGLYIRLRHNAHISTAYAHMSRFARGITRGTRVAQGEIIGYVGSSGESTGSHLHYEILVDNVQVNPLTVDIPVNAGLSGKQLAAFQDWRNRIHTQFEQLIASAEANDTSRLAQNQNASATPPQAASQ